MVSQDFFNKVCYNITMLTKETNELGAITLSESLVNQILTEAIAPWEGKARYAGERQIRCGDDGLYIYAALRR